MYVLRFLCSFLAALVAFFRVGFVPSFCARLGPPSPVHLLGASASYFPSQPAPSLVSAPLVCLVPPPTLGHSCSAAESDSRWHASAVNTRLHVDLLDPTPTNSHAFWHESSDGEQEASSFALVVLVGVAAIIVLQQYLGSGGSKSSATAPVTVTLPPLVLPPPPPPWMLILNN